MKRCECCGAVILEESIFKPGTIKDKILNVIREYPGISGPDLKKRVMSHNAADNLLSVHINGINKVLVSQEPPMKIYGRPRHGYKLLLIEEPAHDSRPHS